MRSTVIPDPLVVFFLILAVFGIIGGYILGWIDGREDIEALKAQYAEEDKKAAEAVAKLLENKDKDCQVRVEDILHNMHSGS